MIYEVDPEMHGGVTNYTISSHYEDMGHFEYMMMWLIGAFSVVEALLRG